MAGEYAVDLGDVRRNRRAQRVGTSLATKPELSLPQVFEDEADLEGAYRLLGNPEVAWRELLAAHVTRTQARAAPLGEVAVAHDTSEAAFRQYWPDRKRAHMSGFTSRTQGFFIHASVAVTAQGLPLPLGVLAVQPFVHGRGLDASDTASTEFWKAEGGLFDNEHERWFRAVAATTANLAKHGVAPIHVMDRETDSYGLLSWLHEGGYRFVVRCDAARKLKCEGGLREVGVLTVQLGERFPLRDGKTAETHPPRKARTAQLTVRAGVVTLRRTRKARDASWSPGGAASQPMTVELNFVEAVELHPPLGETGVRWLLLTSEPIATAEDVLRVVDLYRRRWLIEEYFKALKTGCRLEERQMDSAATMLRILALLLPAAWRLLLLRAAAAEAPDAHWKTLLTPLEFRILARAVPKAKLQRDATVARCCAAIAKLGGHLPRNGPPGWQTLHAGWRELHEMVLGARLAGGSDQ
jgi:hypothetical protein